MRELTLPSTVTRIEATAFDHCNQLTAIHYSGDINSLTVEEDWVRELITR